MPPKVLSTSSSPAATVPETSTTTTPAKSTAPTTSEPPEPTPAPKSGGVPVITPILNGLTNLIKGL